jgi:DeoR/GlpR family transcriptional regulator of sugar metabolism
MRRRLQKWRLPGKGVAMKQTSTSSNPVTKFKEEASRRAVEFVQSGMKVGLGTGSTAIFAMRRIAELLKTSELSDIVAFATSKATAKAVRLSILCCPTTCPKTST